MIYSIAADVAGQEVDAEILREEVAESGFVTGFDGIIVIGDSLEIRGTVSNQSGLNALVHDHTPYSLPNEKALKVQAIDARTREIIAGGFAFDGHQFSLSTQAQTNWLGLISLQSMFSWPVSVTTNADTAYSLAQANIGAFVGTGCGTIAAAIGSGRALKIAANAASNRTELEAVVDSR